ncbi:MAG: Na/Pi cotransporter family protein [Proteobacteria bacterium]|nr:Na/Pi cotransporter family protein [Pseudomonadota bacterium]MBU1139900.1 Na/Pi cotransporter family protein [Pseudomonadota bacterium]MBU1233948.1 Na/Pi cotransporter family protein [Pseudomonadota bacterium]MBU1420769.1 Na/Pi cotransporter family protein [Pseudomonadota bacterium]MBU1456883.1 Na/Pi cotransporter family protein [Pseudomonadota bacterium]
MEIFSITTQILGGLALFLFSINRLSSTLKKIAGVRLKQILQKATANRLLGAATGTLVTFFVQSSSITVLLLLGMVNAGALNLRQAVYVILGSEIGTTITAQIVAFKVKMLFYPLLMAGFLLFSLAGKEKQRNLGEILFSLGLIFLSMKLMTDGSRPLQDFPLVIDAFSSFGAFPFIGILVGAIFTSVTSSSSATTSLIIAMGMEGVIDLRSGIALMIGANIGTCTLELIASIGTNVTARRTGMAQFLINIIGALLFYPFINSFAEIVSHTAHELPRHLANAHTLFNLSVSLILMPFVVPLIKILEKIIPGRERSEAETYGILDERFLKVPSLALMEAEEEVNRMAAITKEMLKAARQAFFLRNKDALKAVLENERAVDMIYEKVGNYLSQISTIMLSEQDRRKKRSYIHAIGDIERIADLAENLAEYAGQKDAVFSDTALREIERLFDKTEQIYSAAINSLKQHRKSLVLDITRMEESVDTLEEVYRKEFIRRMQTDLIIPAKDAMYPRILQDLERISDHANNIAEHVMKM